MILKLVKLRDVLSKRIADMGGEKHPCVKAGKVNITLGDEYLIVDSVTGGSLMSEIFINCHRRKK